MGRVRLSRQAGTERNSDIGGVSNEASAFSSKVNQLQ